MSICFCCEVFGFCSEVFGFAVRSLVLLRFLVLSWGILFLPLGFWFCLWIYNLWWPTTVTAKPKTSQQKQNYHGKTKNVTAKTKYLMAKPKTLRQKQIVHSKSKIALVLPWVFAFAVRYLVFALKYLVLPWGLWFCREVFGFVVRYFVFAVRFLVLPWGFCFCRWVFGFAVRYFVFAMRFLVLPWQLWATVTTRCGTCFTFCHFFFLNRINDFNGKTPFDFQNCCSVTDNKHLGKLSGYIWLL